MKPIKLFTDLSFHLYEGEAAKKRGAPTPITYLTQWKIVGNSQVHTDPFLTSWKVSGNSIVDNNTILSCGDLGQDGKYHVKISNGVNVYDIALTEPLRKVGNVADSIEFPCETEGKALVTRIYTQAKVRDLEFKIIGQLSNCKRFRSKELETKHYSNTACNILFDQYTCMSIQNANAADQPYIIASYIEQLYLYCPLDINTNDKFNEQYGDYDIVYELTTPTTELIDVSPFPVSPTDTYTSANVVPYSAFEHTENKEIWSCGEYNEVDGKYHILVQPQGGSIADIALTEPLRKVNDVADTIEFPAALEAFCNKDGSQIQTTLPDDTILHIRQIVKNGDFSNGTNSWNRARYVSISASNNKLHIITNEADVSGNNYSWAGVNEAVRAELAVNENVYIHYTANPNRNMNVGLDGTGGGVYAQECVQDIDNDISCVKKLTTVNTWYFGFNRGTHEVNDEVIISNVYSFDLDAMFADCPSLKPSTASDFEALFPNISYIAYSDTAIDVIVKGGKLYKYVETEGYAVVTRPLKSINLYDYINSISRKSTYKTSTDSIYAYTIGTLSDVLPPPTNDTLVNGLCSAYIVGTRNNTYRANKTCIAVSDVKTFYIYDQAFDGADDLDAFKAHITEVKPEFIYELATPTTELVDAPQIQEADSYSMVISQGGKAVSWSSFETE